MKVSDAICSLIGRPATYDDDTDAKRRRTTGAANTKFDTKAKHTHEFATVVIGCEGSWNPTKVCDSATLYGGTMGPITFTNDGTTDDKPGGSIGYANRPTDLLPTAPNFTFNSPSVMEELVQDLKSQLDDERRNSLQTANAAQEMDDACSASGDENQDAPCESNAHEAGTTSADLFQSGTSGTAPAATTEGITACGTMSSLGLVVTPQQLNAAKQNKRRAAEAKIARAACADSSTRTGSWQMGAGAGPKRIVGAVQEWWDKRRTTLPEHQGPSATGCSKDENEPAHGHAEEADCAPVPVEASSTAAATATSSTAKPARARNLANEQLQNAKRA